MLSLIGVPGDAIFEACRSGVAVLAAHTNLDLARGGLNDLLASLFNLNGTEVLKKADGFPGMGLGRIGDLQEAALLSSFAGSITALLGSDALRVSGGGKKEIKRVAVVAGSGGSLIPMAFEKGADVLVTGDIDHHEAMQAESLGMALIDAGHFETEKKAFSLFGDRFKDMLKEEGLDIVLENWQEERSPMKKG